MTELAWQTFEVSEKMKLNLKKLLAAQPDIFSYESNQALASLVCVLGLQSEIGIYGLDRLSTHLDIELKNDNENPWASEIIVLDGLLGLRLKLKSEAELRPLHTDFASIIDSSSLDSEGKLKQLIIIPERVFQKYKNRGLELVIVKDWVLSAFLSDNAEQRVNYLLTNNWEVQNHSTRHQVHLMKNKQVAFSGTHDLADHLLGGNQDGFFQNQSLYNSLYDYYSSNFTTEYKMTDTQLNLSYLIGILLDDMAQPVWYGCGRHRELLIRTFDILKESVEYPIYDKRQLPNSCEALITKLRTVNIDFSDVLKSYYKFILDLQHLH